ncbi:MAG TPA: class I SAM-dependent methyltransferase [Lysobacter sp.]
MDLQGRWPKAEKIRRLLDLDPAALPQVVRLLEIGAGSGAIAHYFSAHASGRYVVSAVDVADQRQVREGYDFQTYDGSRLPFADVSFDAVISNHVIEHVGTRAEQAQHLREIARVLAPAGRAYLCTPSRWQLVEPHFGLPFLSWIPQRWRDGYVRLAGRGANYDCDPLSHAGLERLLIAGGIGFRNINVPALVATLDIEADRHTVVRSLLAFLSWLSPRTLELLRRASPTMVYLLDRVPVPAKGR